MTEDNLNMAYWCAKQVIVLNFCENYVICVKLCYLCQNYVICVRTRHCNALGCYFV